MSPRHRWKQPLCFGVLGLTYFVVMAQIPVILPLKLPLAALPLQIAALGYVAWYWQRRSHRAEFKAPSPKTVGRDRSWAE